MFMRVMINRSLWLYVCLFLVLTFVTDEKRAAMQRARYLLGVFYNQNMTNYKDGVVYFDYRLTRNDQDLEALTGLGYCYFQLGDYPRAVNYYQQALKINPESSAIKESLQTARRRIRSHE